MKKNWRKTKGGIAVFGEMFKSPPPAPPPPPQNRKKIIKISARKRAACETVRPMISFEPRTENWNATRLRPYWRIIYNQAERGVGGVGGGFSTTGRGAKGSWKGLGFGNRQTRFLTGLPRFFQTRGCAKQKSHQRFTHGIIDQVVIYNDVIDKLFSPRSVSYIYHSKN